MHKNNILVDKLQLASTVSMKQSYRSQKARLVQLETVLELWTMIKSSFLLCVLGLGASNMASVMLRFGGPVIRLVEDYGVGLIQGRSCVCFAGRTIGGAGLSQPTGAQTMLSQASDAADGATGFDVSVVGLWSCFSPVCPFDDSTGPFWNRSDYSMSL